MQDGLLRIEGFCCFGLLLAPMHEVQSKSKDMGLEFGTELIQKYLGDGPSWYENSFVLLMSFPHPLSLSTKLMPLGQKGRFSSCTTLDRTIQFFLHRYTSDSSNLRDVL